MSPATLPANIPPTGPVSARQQTTATSTEIDRRCPANEQSRQRGLERQRQRHRNQDPEPLFTDASPAAGVAASRTTHQHGLER